MLKLNNSFCRYWGITYENIQHNKPYAKQLTHWSCKNKICFGWNHQQSFLCQLFPTILQCRLLASIKKKFHFKTAYKNINATGKQPTQMSDSAQPTFQHVSYGGKFEVSDDESTSSGWRRQTEGNKHSRDIPPDFRVWEPVGTVNDTSTNTSLKFKIMSYNVLAQYLLECHSYLYTGCSSRNLNWKVRADKIYDEISKLAPDILCLQEVQVSHLNTFYNKFKRLGYYGIFKQKTGLRQDGCAIYFKESLFHLENHVTVEFYQPELPLLNRDNIGLMVKLTPKEMPNTPIIVATTHLLYNPKRTDIRLAQIQVLLAEIDRFAYCDNGSQSDYLPTILTGDFNSTPDSAVVQLLDRGHVRSSKYRDDSDWQRIGVTDNCQHLAVYINRQKGESTHFIMTKIRNSEYMTREPSPEIKNHNEEYRELFNSGKIGHSLKLSSVYHRVKADGRMEATTFQDYWLTVDYIYFSYCSSLKLVERLRLPTATECEVLGQLPNDTYGSDHLALAATFELKPFKPMP